MLKWFNRHKRVNDCAEMTKNTTHVDDLRVIDGAITDLRLSAWDCDIRIYKDDKLQTPTARLVGDVSVHRGKLPRLKVHSGNIVVTHYSGCRYSGTLALELAIPATPGLKNISASSTFGNVTCNGVCLNHIFAIAGKKVTYNGVCVSQLRAMACDGDVEVTNTRFDDLCVRAWDGDVNLQVTAENDISSDISTTSGNVTVQLAQIAQLNAKTTSLTGVVARYLMKSGGSYTANMAVSTSSGNIVLR